MPVSTKARHGMEFLLFRLLQEFLQALPRTAVLWIGRSFGWTVGRIFRFRWQTTLSNLRQAFPEKGSDEIIATAARSYESVGAALFELVWLPRLKPDRLSAIVRVLNPDALRSAHARGTGVIVLTAHYGSWEVLGQIPKFVLGIPGSLLVRGLSNSRIDRSIDEIRRSFGNVTVHSTLAVRELLHALRSGGWILMAADQSAPRESVVVRFFGRDVPTYQGPAMLALRTGAQIVLGLAHRAVDGLYDIRFEHIPTDDYTDASPESVADLTARHARATEKAMRIAPEQWMWMHRRWKHVEQSTQAVDV